MDEPVSFTKDNDSWHVWVSCQNGRKILINSYCNPNSNVVILLQSPYEQFRIKHINEWMDKDVFGDYLAAVVGDYIYGIEWFERSQTPGKPSIKCQGRGNMCMCLSKVIHIDRHLKRLVKRATKKYLTLKFGDWPEIHSCSV